MAVIIDAVDGTFARLVDVKAVLPNFDGTLLDNLVDYANYVIVPAWIIHRAHLVPDGISLCIASSICLASCYQFCQNNAKTSDHFFRGFPSYWNVVSLYLLALGLSPLLNLAIVVTLIFMVFVPVKYIYVTRTREYRAITFPSIGGQSDGADDYCRDRHQQTANCRHE
jgi:phosphatidylcholine synthase